MPPNGSFEVGRDGAFDVRQLGRNGSFLLVGELDLAATDRLFDALEPAIADGGVLTLDLSELTFLDVAGTRAIVEVGRQVAGRGSVVLWSPSALVTKVLGLMEADTFPSVYIASQRRSA